MSGKYQLSISCAFLLFLLCSLPIVIRAQWVHAKGTDRQQVYTFAVKESTIFAGANHGIYPDTMYVGGAFRSTDNGSTWIQINNGFVSGTIYSIDVNSFIVVGESLFAGTSNGVFVSQNNGNSWTSVSSGLDSNIYSRNVRALLVRGSKLIAGTANGIFVSSNKGENWVRTDSGFTSMNVKCFCSNDSLIVAGTKDNGIFFSTDDGISWNHIYMSSGWSVSSLAQIGLNLFAGIPDGAGVMLTTDMGRNWKRVTSGLKDTVNHYTLYVTSLASSGNNLFAGTLFYGLYLSTDFGGYWNPVNNGLNLLFGVSSVFVTGKYIFVGADHGIWRRPLSEIVTPVRYSQSLLPKECALFQNYPNPFNASTVISYQLSNRGFVAVEIYDILGRKVEALVSEYESQGQYSVIFDGSQYSSGIYFYQLIAPGVNETRKMLIAK